MVLAYELTKPETVPNERLFRLIQRARRIALEVEGVYDLALYQPGRTGEWRCTVDLDDRQAGERLQTNERFQQVWAELRALGVRIVQLDRRV